MVSRIVLYPSMSFLEFICGTKFMEKSVLFPVKSLNNLPSSRSLLWSFVPRGAFNNPTIAVTIPLSWMKFVSESKIVWGSLSNPTMNPPWTSRPACWIFFTLAMRSRFLFWILLHSIRLSSFGDSMPMNTASNSAFTISCISVSSSARLIDSSVLK